jgi:hypothetical protein
VFDGDQVLLGAVEDSRGSEEGEATAVTGAEKFAQTGVRVGQMLNMR